MPTVESVRMFRGPVCPLGRDGEGKVESSGGRWDAGIIRNAAVITRGEAMGHGLWIDAVMLKQTAKGINSDSPVARYTHPSFSDSIGTVLGRWTAARVDGDKVRADLHFLSSARKAPGGNYLDYILSLAEEDPASFGVSIAFAGDYEAESAFVKANLDKKGKFQSPDSENKDNLPHARISLLTAADLVGEPAANPSGLFHKPLSPKGPTWKQRRNARAIALDK